MAGVRVLFAGYQRDSDKELTLAVKNIRNAGATLDVQVETPSRFLLGPKAPSAHRTTVTNHTTHVIVSRRFSIKPWTQQSLVSDILGPENATGLGAVWILNHDWLSQSLSQSQRLPEEQFLLHSEVGCGTAPVVPSIAMHGTEASDQPAICHEAVQNSHDQPVCDCNRPMTLCPFVQSSIAGADTASQKANYGRRFYACAVRTETNGHQQKRSKLGCSHIIWKQGYLIAFACVLNMILIPVNFAGTNCLL
jgi:hypothetical protein